MRVFLGVDWADGTHRVAHVDEQGQCVAIDSLEESVTGLAEFGRWLEAQREAGIEVYAGIERPDGRVVEMLLRHGAVVYALNPKAVDRARDRHRANRCKDDDIDAYVIGELVRTDHPHLHALLPNSAQCEELRSLTRDYHRFVRRQTRLLQQLTATLKDYYPLALEMFADLTTQTAQDFLQRYGTPAKATALTRQQWTAFVRRHRMAQADAEQRWAKLRAGQVLVPDHVVRANARRMDALLRELATVLATVADYRAEIERCFAALPASKMTASLPVGGDGVVIATIWAGLGDAEGRWSSPAHFEAHAGVVPGTQKSGKQRTGVIFFRHGCDHLLRYALTQYAFISLGHCEWAKAYYKQQRARGHRHPRALRALGAKWAKIFVAMWQRQMPYDENYHLANIARQQLRRAA
jgi:transposase